MALDTLPADGKLPAAQPGKPDLELATAWVREHGGTIEYYYIPKQGDPETLAGHVTCAAPTVNDHGKTVYSIPRSRSLAEEKKQADYLDAQRPKETEQPKWDYWETSLDTQYKPAVVNRPPAEDVPLQPDFGWTPNPEDLDPVVARQKDVVGGDKVPVTEPDFHWDNGLTDQKPVNPADVNRPPSTDPIGQPDFGWNPQRKLIAMGDAAIAKIRFKVGDVLNPAIFFEKTVHNDELEFSVDNANATLASGSITAAKAGKVSLTASIVHFPQFSQTVTLTVTA